MLGIGSPDAAAKRLRRQARPYAAGGKPLMPAFELIATIALAGKGRDGKYRMRQPERTIRRYLDAARRAKAILVLDVQPGQADFMDEVRALRRWLREPDVSLALDPEWSMQRGQKPGSVIGHTTAGKVNQVSAYLADIVRRRNLPQKVLLLHQFTDSMIRGRSRIRQRPGIAMTINVDGFGTPAQKRGAYGRFAFAGDSIFDGFKLFYQEDTRLMRPRDVLRLRPQPSFVVYE